MITLQASTAEPLNVAIITPYDPTTSGPPTFALSTVLDPGVVTARTRDVLGNFDPSEILFYSAPTPGADPHVQAEWTLGQPDSSTNADGTATRGFWYPNVTSGHAPYLDADYAFQIDPADGLGAVETSLTDGFATTHASQLWRNEDWQAAPGNFGNNLPTDFYMSWWPKYPQQIYYLNSSGPTFGFANHVQVYATQGSTTGPFISAGAATNLGHNEAHRWHFDLNKVPQFDLPHLEEINVPLDTYSYMEWHVTAAYPNGRWEVWGATALGQPLIKILDYSGPTVFGATKLGISWGVYGTLQTPTNPSIWYRDIAITTKPVYPYLTSSTQWMPGTWASSWDPATGKILARTPLIGAAQALGLTQGVDYRLFARWTAGTETPVKLAETIRAA